ncbi:MULTISPECIES: tetratricopeptide repeat protein [Limnospira]|uniref:Tetratricopeptide repeat protein n=1 Tax=Limnospira fusiformis PMC 851.14 TaxID=2219512 RepID=A0ABU9ETQ0_LIMFS|nr:MULTISPECIES: tetratricopeptide repeat protein [unclassified Limnospira]MDT9188946.1 tetratricopeptide repeat protein [Limnospira sp. PMC 894.15]MDT9235983.1 tetratricopeptide repeat protein [Limnospira sp. PMC 917.15]MDT9275752.1 tetratricopeptide repeat protein [Limnospira sp. PMC 737.11]QJB26313.1 tetratricopeptide repeat protein [Limnospira fusiformis SAG 85.79]
MGTVENSDSLRKHYGDAIARRMERRKKLQKVIMFISTAAFLGMMSSGLGAMFRSNSQSSEVNQAEEVATIVSQLERQEQGYQSVLQREPENQTALEGLVMVRLQQNKLEEAIAPLEKLVSLYPDIEDYQNLLKQLKADTQTAVED